MRKILAAMTYILSWAVLAYAVSLGKHERKCEDDSNRWILKKLKWTLIVLSFVMTPLAIYFGLR
ncbi:MAG: hypothetical protein WC471_03605 [Candidatus Woesearchaeota archaeon]|jgi:hypothetical protein